MTDFTKDPTGFDPTFMGGVELGLFGLKEGIKASVAVGAVSKTQAIEVTDFVAGAILSLAKQFDINLEPSRDRE